MRYRNMCFQNWVQFIVHVIGDNFVLNGKHQKCWRSGNVYTHRLLEG